MRQINDIIVHCSATRAGVDFHAADIKRWHRDRGFATIGYHFVVDLDGLIEIGRPIAQTGAHCIGHNAHSIGVCYIGGLDAHSKPADTRTSAQRASLEKLLRQLVGQFHCPIFGHRDFSSKACPCFDARAEYDHIYREWLQGQLWEVCDVLGR